MLNRAIPKEYYNPGRFYHGAAHILKMREVFASKFDKALMAPDIHIIQAAIDYHDIVYDPTSSENEELSCVQFELYCQKHPGEYSDEEIVAVKNIIMSTKTLKPNTDLEKLFLYLDWSIFDASISTPVDISNYNYLVFKEFQSFNYNVFFEKRMEFFDGAIDKIVPAISDCVFIPEETVEDIKTGIALAWALASSFKPSIGVYVGSFDPFHTGHLNVLQKAEKIFDKVIVVQAQNPDKKSHANTLPDSINSRECIVWIGFIGDCLDELESGYESHFAMIRGMRTGQDLIAEQAYQETLKDLECHYPFCFILCDPEYQHVSSSMIRSVEKINLPTAKWKVV